MHLESNLGALDKMTQVIFLGADILTGEQGGSPLFY
jgi:hypothetical protein